MVKKGLLCVLAASGLLWANAATANISGTVVDEAGAPLSRVEIVVTCIDNGRVWSVLTDKGGRFTAPDLPLGDYVLGAFSPGFTTATQGVRLKDGAEEFLKFTLRSDGPVSREMPTVEPIVAPAPVPKKKSTPNQISVSPQPVKSLPVEPSPEPTPEPSPAAAPEPVVSADSQTVGFAVQIAAYQTRNKAEMLRRKLKSGGYPAYIVEANVAGLGRHYRVRVGPFQSAEKTKEVASEVRLRFPQEGPNPWIIPMH